MTSLRYLHLIGCGLNDSCAKMLADVLKVVLNTSSLNSLQQNFFVLCYVNDDDDFTAPDLEAPDDSMATQSQIRTSLF